VGEWWGEGGVGLGVGAREGVVRWWVVRVGGMLVAVGCCGCWGGAGGGEVVVGGGGVWGGLGRSTIASASSRIPASNLHNNGRALSRAAGIRIFVSVEAASITAPLSLTGGPPGVHVKNCGIYAGWARTEPANKQLSS